MLCSRKTRYAMLISGLSHSLLILWCCVVGQQHARNAIQLFQHAVNGLSTYAQTLEENDPVALPNIFHKACAADRDVVRTLPECSLQVLPKHRDLHALGKSARAFSLPCAANHLSDTSATTQPS